MSFQELASELVHLIFNNLSTIPDVINLSLTCHRFHHLLRLAQKLPTLFAAAEREFGPIEDAINLVTYNHSQHISSKRNPPVSYPLLRQIIRVGTVAKKIEALYPDKRWSTDYIFRRGLTGMESYRLRRAIYRYWLYCEAFHNRNFPRSTRLVASVVQERAQLLRIWTTEELLEIEDIRTILEEMMEEICPTDGIVQGRIYDYSHFADSARMTTLAARELPHNFFHSSRDDSNRDFHHIAAPQLRHMQMSGWGDEIAQYHVVQSLLKLSPDHLLSLYERAVHKVQIEAFVAQFGDDWFWNNGQTFLDTWLLVIGKRGLDPLLIREEIANGRLGIALQGCETSDALDCSTLF